MSVRTKSFHGKFKGRGIADRIEQDDRDQRETFISLEQDIQMTEA